jgi:hypothetical protein
MKYIRILPLVIGMLGGSITGAILSSIFPPKSPLDKTFYLEAVSKPTALERK